MNILCADIGTTSLKMGIISENGEVVSSIQKFFDSNADSAAKNEFLANEWILAFTEGCKELLRNSVGDFVRNSSGSRYSARDSFDDSENSSGFRNSAQFSQISAVCISGNGPTLVSENGRTLLWNNSLYKKLKNLPETKSFYIPQFLAFKTFFSEEWKNSKYIFSGPEFLIYKLTGNAFSVLPEERFADAYWSDEELKKFNLETEKIPPFVPLGKNAGNVTKEVAQKLGIGEIPVFCGGPDFITALIGTATVESGKICDRSGSSEGINLCSEKPIFKEGFRTLPSAISGLWNISVIIPKSGILLDEYKKEIEDLENRKLSWEEIINYSLDDKNSEGFRILSEISCNVKNAVSALKNLAFENNLPFDTKMRVTGGQAKNERWLAKKAEDCGISLEVCNSPDSELIGNAAIALFGLGKFKTLQEAAKNIVKTTKTFFSNENEKNQKLKIYKIPKNLKTIIFDIDSTLYTNQRYAFEQVDVQIRYWAKKRGISSVQARNEISEFRKNWSKTHGGKKISLGNTLTYFGVSIAESIEMRKNLLEPANFLRRDEMLVQTIKKLREKFQLICVTNNPVLPAQKTLQALGIANLIPDIIGLDTSGKSKPAREPFALAMQRTKSKPEECLSVGDRYDMEISLPLEMGMGAILVTGVSDVYKLPEILRIR